MTPDNVKSRLYSRISAYWSSATVKWGAAPGVKPLSPLVVLRMGAVTRPARPIAQLAADGSYVAAYPSETTLQVDLFTRGKLVTSSSGDYYENTAVSDLLRFVNYLDSPATVDWLTKNDISLYLLGSVQDLSEVVNDTQWSYRAMCELGIGFTEWAAEYESILGDENIKFDEDGNPMGICGGNWAQTASGGGTKELAAETTGFFTEAKINEVDINGE